MPISAWRRLLGRICFSLFLLCTPLFVSPTSAQSSVVIGEVQWAGSENSSADEWIELWNLSNAPFSLNGYRLRGIGSGSDLIFGPQHQIEPQRAFLIANYNGLDPKSTLTITPQVVTTTISITNENTHITFVDPQGGVVDDVSWAKTAPGGSNASPRSSLLRSPNHLAGIAWTSATSSQNLLSAIHQYGTPGFCDGCSTIEATPPPTASVTTPVDSPETSATESQTNNENNATNPTLEPSAATDELPSRAELEQALQDSGVDPISLDTELEKELEQNGDLDDSSPPVYLLTKDPEIPVLDTEESETEMTDLDLDTATTNTELILPTSSTASVIEVMPVTTSTVPSHSSSDADSLDQVSVTTTQQENAPALNEVVTTNTLITAPVSIQEVFAPGDTITAPVTPPFTRKSRASFQELFPSPASGSEWIELSLASNVLPTQLIGWNIRDEKKNILSIQNTTLFTWNESKHLLVFALARNKLTNSGTHLFLVDSLGQIEDEVTMPAVPKNRSWALKENSSWEQTLIATFGEANQFKAATISSKALTSKKVPVSKVIKTAAPKKAPSKTSASKTIKKPESNTSAKKPKATERVTVTNLVSAKANKNSLVSAAKQKTNKKQPAKQTKKASASTSKKKTKVTTEPQSIDLKDIGPMYASTRVRLTGTVATLPRLLGSNAFVIQTDDGRGLYVSGNSKQPSPPFRAHIALTGTLTVNDDGLILHMYASDRWTMQELERAVQTRVPDLDHPSLEDAWSYVQVRGIVTNVTPTRVTMLHDQSEIFISIRPVVSYRAERLKKGDEIEVSGLLDTRKDSLTLLPRLAEEIHLVRSAVPASSAKTAQSRPPLPWMPIGAAGMSIAVTQGARRYWKHRLEQKIRFSQPN